MRLQRIAGWALLIAAVATAAAADYTINTTSSTFVALKNGRHRPGATLSLQLPGALPVGTFLCATYVNNMPQHNRGKVEVNMKVDLVGGGHGSFRVTADVHNNAATPECVHLNTAFSTGDRLTFEFGFTKFRRMKRHRHDQFIITGGLYLDAQQAQAAITRQLAEQRRQLGSAPPDTGPPTN